MKRSIYKAFLSLFQMFQIKDIGSYRKVEKCIGDNNREKIWNGGTERGVNPHGTQAGRGFRAFHMHLERGVER